MSSQADLLSTSFAALGLAPVATHQQVREAYRDLVQVWHPDRFSHNARLRAQSERKLKEINNAYELLEKYFSGEWKPPEEETVITTPLTARLLELYSRLPYKRAITLGLGLLCLIWIVIVLKDWRQDNLSSIQGEWIYTRDSMLLHVSKVVLVIHGKKAQWTVYFPEGGEPMLTEADIVRVDSRPDGTMLAIIGGFPHDKSNYETTNVGLFLKGDEMEVALLEPGKTPDQATKDDLWRFHRTGR